MCHICKQINAINELVMVNPNNTKITDKSENMVRITCTDQVIGKALFDALCELWFIVKPYRNAKTGEVTLNVDLYDEATFIHLANSANGTAVVH